jgi:hypothetical protein
MGNHGGRRPCAIRRLLRPASGHASAVATASLIAAAARALHEAGHPAVAEALSLFLAGAGFEDALGRQSPTCFDQFEYCSNIVGCVIDEMPLGERRDNDCWHPCARPPPFDLRGRHMIPVPTVSGVGHDDHRVIPDEALLDFVDNHRGVIVAANKFGVPGMFVIGADWFVEAHRGG